MHEERVTEWLKSIEGVATALKTAAAAIIGVYAATSAWLASSTEYLRLPLWVAQVAALLPLLPILLLGWRSYRRFAKASRVEQPDRFALSVSTPESLIGRAEELANLLDSVGKNRVVLLDGESGCGKSALVAAGLVPRLRTGNGLLPVLVRDWGDDWVRGPLATALGALFDVLTPEQRTMLGWTQMPDLAADATALAAELSKRFADVAEKLGRRPLLITDQLDDYQAQHRAKFLDESGNWLKPDVLAATNPFWGLASEQLRAGAMHLLAVSRSDTASGLSCLRFLDPAMTADRKLPRVDLAYLRPLLERIAPNAAVPAVVSQPNQGWDELRERLEADLRLQGAILMQQVRTVLLGIRQLPVLTIAAYRRAGELRGMESLVVARAIWRAADAAGGGESGQSDARRLVRALVLPGGPNLPPKARRVAFSALAGLTSDGSRATLMLRALQANDVVRPAEGVGGELAWQLDHDYLAQAVLAEARQADRWGIALSEGLGRFRYATGNWRQRWAALLPVTVQVRIAWERVQGRLRYGEAAAYARLSLIKPGLALLVVGAASIGTHALYEDRLLSAQARAIYERFGGADEAAAVLTAWRAPEALRDRIFRLVHEDDGRLERATGSHWPLAHGGLETDRLIEAARMLRERLVHGTYSGDSSSLVHVYATVAARLSDQTVIKQEVEALRERLVREADSGVSSSLAQAYTTVAERLSDQTVIKQEVEALRERLVREADSGVSSSLAQAYTTVAERLSDQTVIKQEVEALRERLVRETDSGVSSSLASVYATVAARLSDQAVIKQAAETLRERLARETDSDVSLSLAPAYATVAARLSDQTTIKQAAEALRERLARETNSRASARLAEGYSTVVASLSDQTAIRQEAEALRGRLARETNFDISLILAQIYATVAARFSDQTTIKQEAEALLHLLARGNVSGISSSLASAYAAVAARLSDQTVIKQEAEALRKLLARETNFITSLSLARAYAAVAARLSDQTAIKQAAEALRERLARETNPRASAMLAEAYATAAASLSDQTVIKQAAEALRERLARERLARETDSRVLSTLARAYATVAARLTDQTAIKQAAEALRECLEHETAPDIFSMFEPAFYATLADKLPHQNPIRQEVETLREMVARETLSGISSSLAHAYATVAARLSDQTAIKQEAEALHERLKRVNDYGISPSLAYAFTTVATRLSDQTAIKQEAKALRERLARETIPHISEWLANTYAKLARRHMEAETLQHDRKAAEFGAREILTLAGHPFIGDATPLLTALEPIAGRTFGSDTGAAVAWWVREFNGDPATLR